MGLPATVIIVRNIDPSIRIFNLFKEAGHIFMEKILLKREGIAADRNCSREAVKREVIWLA